MWLEHETTGKTCITIARCLAPDKQILYETFLAAAVAARATMQPVVP
jgi:hypothetical protein